MAAGAPFHTTVVGKNRSLLDNNSPFHCSSGETTEVCSIRIRLSTMAMGEKNKSILDKDSPFHNGSGEKTKVCSITIGVSACFHLSHQTSVVN
jgi:hypothetical protein